MSTANPVEFGTVQVVSGQAGEAMRDDVALLQRIVARDEHAVAALYDRHSRLLFGLILRILHDRSEAEEILQEVFLAVWSKAESYDASLGAPVAWLVRIARNRSIDRVRASSVRARTLKPVDETTEAAAELLPASDNPESSAARREERESIRRALAALPCDQRDLIEHAYFLGLTHSELASRFGLPLGTVKTRVRTGMHALREQLSSYA